MIPKYRKLLLCSAFLFIIVFCLLGSAVQQIWFREDDLGTILNGLMLSWDDVVRVFSADCRSFITPANYQRTVPNVISGFLRPMQNVVFTIIYTFWDVNPWAYFYAHVALHAANTVLFFLLCSMLMSCWISFFAALLFAFYPDVAWLPWIGTVQNSLSVFFLLLCVIVWLRYVVVRYIFASFHSAKTLTTNGIINVSLCFIETFVTNRLISTWLHSVKTITTNGIINVPFGFVERFATNRLISTWLHFAKTITMNRLTHSPFMVSVLLSAAKQNVSNHEPKSQNYSSILAGLLFLCSLLSRETAIFLPFWFFVGAALLKRNIKQAWFATWVFFAANVFYVVMRFWAFGCDTLPRTLRNIMLRYPWLASYIGQKQHIAISTIATQQTPIQSAGHVSGSSSEVVASLFNSIASRYASWFGAFFNINLKTNEQIIIASIVGLLLVLFLCVAYRGKYHILCWLLLGLVCVCWPGVLAYPSPRYLNMVYPFLVFILMYGVYCALTKSRDRIVHGAAIVMLSIALIITFQGIHANRCNLRSATNDRFIYKQRFDDFFTRYTFEPQTQFVLVSSPFVSDIQSIFQAYLHNLSTMVIFDPFATLAEFGCMGCRKSFRVTGVLSEIVPIPAGFRLISHDQDHVGWWLRFSDFPIAWLATKRAYEWTAQPYQQGCWYACSVGKFKINHMIDADCVSDISFVYDPQWINEHTVFVAWNTTRGRYEVLDGYVPA